jgi:hypothetical protein
MSGVLGATFNGLSMSCGNILLLSCSGTFTLLFNILWSYVLLKENVSLKYDG